MPSWSWSWSCGFSLALLSVALLNGSVGVARAAGDGMAAIDQDSFASLAVENSDDVWLIELCVRRRRLALLLAAGME